MAHASKEASCEDKKDRICFSTVQPFPYKGSKTVFICTVATPPEHTRLHILIFDELSPHEQCALFSSLCHLLTSANHLASQPECVNVVCVHTGYVVPCGGQTTLLSLIYLPTLAVQGAPEIVLSSPNLQHWIPMLEFQAHLAFLGGLGILTPVSRKPRQAIYPQNCAYSLFLGRLS
ncbi:hypothetical protein LEMLEM_LOCUS13780 [Lemmus lemmus]